MLKTAETIRRRLKRICAFIKRHNVSGILLSESNCCELIWTVHPILKKSVTIELKRNGPESRTEGGLSTDLMSITVRVPENAKGAIGSGLSDVEISLYNQAIEKTIAIGIQPKIPKD